MTAPATRGRRRLLRVALLVVLAAAVVVLLFAVVFPWFDETFVNDPVLGRVSPTVLHSTAAASVRRRTGGP